MLASWNPALARLWRVPCGVGWGAVGEAMAEHMDGDVCAEKRYAPWCVLLMRGVLLVRG